MMQHAIEITDLSKAYRIGLSKGRPDTLVSAIKQSIMAPLTNWRALQQLDTRRLEVGDDREGVLWALRNVSMSIDEGDVVGIVGRNGSGKSTLLKVISRITEPTRGRVVIRGRVSSLLEVGTGFHPDLSGRDNIYMNGTVLGMKKFEIDKTFDEIVEFSGVEAFLDTPIKRYSSGMKVRLAFAVAAHLEPEVLLVDEVLAVGDVAFQKKCLGKMKQTAGSGRTVIFVSHNMLAVRSLCTKAIFLSEGRLLHAGNVSEVMQRYLEVNNEGAQDEWTSNQIGHEALLHVSRIRADLLGEQPKHKLRLQIDLKSIAHHARALLAVDFSDPIGNRVMQALPTMEPFIDVDYATRTLTVNVALPPLIPGDYSVGIWIGGAFTQTFVNIEDAVRFSIANSPTLNRSQGHDNDRGFIVPEATVEIAKPA